MKFFGLLLVIFTTSAIAQVSIRLERPYYNNVREFTPLESVARIEIEPMYKSFVTNVEQLYGVKCNKLDISYGYRGFVERDRLKTKCTSDKGSVTLKVVIQDSADKTFIRALKVLPGKGMRSQF